MDFRSQKTRKWTIRLARIPLYKEKDVEAMHLDQRLYEVSDVQIDGEDLRCTSVSMVMEPGKPVRLLLEVMPRNLEIVMEGNDGDQKEAKQSEEDE